MQSVEQCDLTNAESLRFEEKRIWGPMILIPLQDSRVACDTSKDGISKSYDGNGLW